MNSYPYLDNNLNPVTDAQLGEIVPPVRKSRVIDITESPLVPASELRTKLDILLRGGELDSGLPILRDNILVGFIPAPELEFALDTLEAEDAMCLMSMHTTWSGWSSIEDQDGSEPSDFTQYIDPVCPWSPLLPYFSIKQRLTMFQVTRGT